MQPVLQPHLPPKRNILTVSELNAQSKAVLESMVGTIWLSGEISNLTRATSGHWYFSLKDSQSQIRCAMFKFKVQTINFTPKEGDHVVVKGKVSLYEARGDYQLIADYMEPAGLGDLQQKLNALIEKLDAEGLFAKERKQSIPAFPKRIGVITSPTGAAIHDVLTVLQRRSPITEVIVYPTQVQGASASQEVTTALEKAIERNECDVLIMTRGGGSLEDLWCFNDETLAYKIVACPIPIIAAIGHEVDVTITELVADLRAATPSAAAELASMDASSLRQRVDGNMAMIQSIVEQKLLQMQTRLNIARLKLADPATAISHSQHQLEILQHKLHMSSLKLLQIKKNKLDQLQKKLILKNPKDQLQQNAKNLIQFQNRLKTAWSDYFNRATHQLHLKAQKLDNISPLSTLNRGYSITKDAETGHVISSIKHFEKNQQITIKVKDGEADATVDKIR
ncbi:MAG: exodeoxyribonuclease VII large subunit [Gammaproteobacteria bacterium]|nr:exodeoxyribonuclease VII large subunit [Gammaproteobacteria bacterium]